MGGRGSSSKRKEKRDKISSKKKSRRKESKKRRHYDSDSSSSDDDSSHLKRSSKSDHKRIRHKKPRRDSSLSDYSNHHSSDSDSSSTDDNEYKSRKARRSRISAKDTKKKSRKRSTSSIGDVEASSGRKRKRTGRDDDIRPKKKSSKKKSRKDLSSSDSESCSTCQSGSSGSEANDKRRRNRISSDKEKGGRRGRGSDKGRRHKNKDRSPSCTSARSSSPAPSVSKYDEEFYPVNNSRRLKSVITVVHQQDSEEEDRLEKDPHKEEMVYDQNDYPSPKSLDSNEGGSKMESDNQFNAASSEEVRELGKSRIDEGDHSNEERKTNKSVPVAAMGGDDLEVILRQKALENLMKFRKRPQTCPKSNTVKINNETNVASLSNSTVNTVKDESTEKGSFNAQAMDQKSEILLQREIREVVKLPDSEPVEKSSQPGLSKLNDAALLQEEDKSASYEANLVKDVLVSNTSSVAEDTEACSSKVELASTEPSTGEQSSDQRNEAKDGSQFEQKTMTVMRGGELVQVSYKVYIPKKAPALARRQFRR